MKLPLVPFQILFAFIFLMSCQTRRDQILSDVRELEALSKHSTAQTDTAVSFRLIRLMNELTEKYPPSLSLTKDSMERIFRKPLPSKIGKYSVWGLRLVNGPDNDLGNPYFYKGRVQLGVPSAPYSVELTVVDAGFTAEWMRIKTQSVWQEVADGTRNPKPDSEGYTIQSVLDQDGQRWAVSENEKQFKRYETLWNNRILISIRQTGKAFDPDAAVGPELLPQLVDIDWLNQLK